MSDFLSGTILGKPVFRMGLALNYGIGPGDLEQALEQGINYIFWTSLRTGPMREPLSQALQRDRSRMIIATGASPGYFGWNVRRTAEAALKELKTDYLDIFQLNWLGVASAWTDGTVGELQKLKEEGKIRATGISIHDRPRAARLAGNSPLDMMMIRYNAAHPGAEQDLFAHLSGPRPEIVAYTATSWGKLLQRPKGWEGPLPSASDCYRFCLSNPRVKVVLSGPSNAKELQENLAGLQKGKLSEEEERWMREFGKKARG